MSYIDVVESLHRLVKDMACCGNCKNYKYGNLCDGQPVSHDSWCESWVYDGLARNKREVSDDYY
jgi:hypothetical protein